MAFKSKIKATLIHALHNSPSDAWKFIENHKHFQEDLEETTDWEKELAVREIYKGRMPFKWSPWDDDIADPVASDEYYDNLDWCGSIQDICLFIQNIDIYI